MSKLTALALAVLLTTSSISLAQPRKPIRQAGHVGAWSERQNWPGRPMCDDGGYRIRPCDIGDGRGG